MDISDEQCIVLGQHVVFMFSEREKSKDWEQNISNMKQTFEKQLQSERTLKIQASLFTLGSIHRLNTLPYFVLFKCE